MIKLFEFFKKKPNSDVKKDVTDRRKFLSVGSGALAIAGLTLASAMTPQMAYAAANTVVKTSAYATLEAAYAACPTGGVVYVDGPTSLTTDLTWSKNISLIGDSIYQSYVVISPNKGIKVTTPNWALNNVGFRYTNYSPSLFALKIQANGANLTNFAIDKSYDGLVFYTDSTNHVGGAMVINANISNTAHDGLTLHNSLDVFVTNAYISSKDGANVSTQLSGNGVLFSEWNQGHILLQVSCIGFEHSLNIWTPSPRDYSNCTSHTQMSNCSFDNGSGSSYISGTYNLSVRGSWISGGRVMGVQGMVITNNEGLIFTENQLCNCGTQGLYSNVNPNCIITNNMLSNNSVSSPGTHYDAIMTNMPNSIVSGNIKYDIPNFNGTVHGVGIYIA